MLKWRSFARVNSLIVGKSLASNERSHPNNSYGVNSRADVPAGLVREHLRSVWSSLRIANPASNSYNLSRQHLEFDAFASPFSRFPDIHTIQISSAVPVAYQKISQEYFIQGSMYN